METRKGVRLLNAQLTNELSAVNQYFIHARMNRHWGLGKIAKKEHEESIGEMKKGAAYSAARVLPLTGTAQTATESNGRCGIFIIRIIAIV